MTTLNFTTHINRPIDDVFHTVSELNQYANWLPPSQLFSEIQSISDIPTRLGTTYTDHGQSSDMQGKVIEFQPPDRVAFQQSAKSPLGSMTIEVRYHLQSVGNQTQVERRQTVNATGILRLLQPLIMRSIRTENERILNQLKQSLTQ
jgi:uncharacterized protein YndB with AHSA1/START domain